jgi:hypothetical protein
LDADAVRLNMGRKLVDLLIDNTNSAVKRKLIIIHISSAPLSMYLSIRALAFACLVSLSMVFQADAACGDIHEAKFNANGFKQGFDGELYCAVKCILHNQYCMTNSNGDDVYPLDARGSSQSDSGPLKAYYGDHISNWCVGLVKDFTAVFQDEVSNT